MNAKIEEKFLQREIKPTASRILVYKVLDKHSHALSLSEIEKNIEHLDRSTVFRSLKTFLEHGLIHSIEDGSGSVRYALCGDDCLCQPKDFHFHFTCTRCGETHCLTDIPFPKIQLPKGYQAVTANFVFKGICPSCS